MGNWDFGKVDSLGKWIFGKNLNGEGGFWKNWILRKFDFGKVGFWENVSKCCGK